MCNSTSKSDGDDRSSRDLQGGNDEWEESWGLTRLAYLNGRPMNRPWSSRVQERNEIISMCWKGEGHTIGDGLAVVNRMGRMGMMRQTGFNYTMTSHTEIWQREERKKNFGRDLILPSFQLPK